MLRGVLVLDSNELIELGKHTEFEKIHIALEDLKEENRVLVNDEDLESILDEVGKPENNVILNNTINKVSALLRSLRDS